MSSTKRTAATCDSDAAAMDQRSLPTREMIIRDGRAIWRICGLGMCVEDPSGTRATAEFEALCRARGIEPPVIGPAIPERGPSDVDEPGV